MTQHELESIVRLVQTTTGAKDVAYVRVDQRGKAMPSGGAVNNLKRALSIGGQTFLYEIRLDTPLEIYDSRQLLKTFVTNEEANIDFRVRIVARTRNVEKIAESLHDRTKSPADIFFETVKKAIKSILEKKLLTGPESIAEHILSGREEWQNIIADKIEDLLGLEAQIIFEGTQIPKTKKIRVEAIAARFRDAPHSDFPLTISATFEPTGERALETFPQTTLKQTTFLRDVVLEACLNDIRLFDYWFDRQRIENSIRQRLNVACRHFAYRSGDVVVEIRGIPDLKIREQIALVVPWSGHRNRSIDFNLDAIMSLNEDGAGLYDSLGRPDRRQWLSVMGAAALPSAMHGRDFYDLTVSEQDSLEQTIRDILTADAAKIGHSIKPVIARVMLPENRWLDKQIIEIEAADYPLKNDFFIARIAATVTIKFANIRPLVNYVDQHKDPASNLDYSKEIEESLQQLVRRTMTIVMRETETNDYFATWEKWEFPFQEDDNVVHGHRNYVRNQLIHAIRKELSQRFLPDGPCDIRLHRDTGQLGGFADYLKGLPNVVVTGEVIPDDAASESEFLPYRLVAHIEHVQAEQWANVIRRGIDFLSIENLQYGLTTAANEFLRGRLAHELEELNYGRRATPGAEATKHAFENYVNRHMEAHYGVICALSIEIGRSIARTAIESQRGLGDRARLAHARRMRNEIENSTAVDDVMIGYEAKRIADLQERIHANPRATDDDLARYNRDKRELEGEREKLTQRETRTRDSVSTTLLEDSSGRRQERPGAKQPPQEDPADDIEGSEGI